MRHTRPLCCGMLLAIFLSDTESMGAELEPFSSAELHRYCLAYARSPDSAEGLACDAYVRAFIEGSSIVKLEIAARDETFSERAFRTRMGIPSGARPRYCINASVTVADFVIQLLLQAERAPPSEDAVASTLILGTLNRFHRCSDKSEPR